MSFVHFSALHVDTPPITREEEAALTWPTRAPEFPTWATLRKWKAEGAGR